MKCSPAGVAKTSLLRSVNKSRHVVRMKEPSLIHRWHPKSCSAKSGRLQRNALRVSRRPFWGSKTGLFLRLPPLRRHATRTRGSFPLPRTRDQGRLLWRLDSRRVSEDTANHTLLIFTSRAKDVQEVGRRAAYYQSCGYNTMVACRTACSTFREYAVDGCRNNVNDGLFTVASDYPGDGRNALCRD